MTVLTPMSRSEGTTGVHLKRRGMFLMCTLVVVLLQLPLETRGTFGAMSRDHKAEEQFDLIVDASCSPFGSLLSCVEVKPLVAARGG
jgi:hypothetical protein